jgi:Arc/MetJ family transcription regulator
LDSRLPRYNIHMKRTNFVLDEQVLAFVTRVLGAKTYSAAVNTAVREVIRFRKIQSLPQFFGSQSITMLLCGIAIVTST